MSPFTRDVPGAAIFLATTPNDAEQVLR